MADVRFRPTKSQLNERREYSAKLKSRGITIDSIVNDINAKHQTKGWGIVTRQIVKDDIAVYFSYQPTLSSDELAEANALRAARLSQIDNDIESLALQISRADLKEKETGKPVWKPFERADVVNKKAMLTNLYMEIMNWNYSKFNANAALLTQGASTIAGQFEAAEKALQSAEKGCLTPIIEAIRAARKHKSGVQEGVIVDVESVQEVPNENSEDNPQN